MYLNIDKLRLFITNDVIKSFRFNIQKNNIEALFKADDFFYNRNISCKIFAYALNTESLSESIQQCNLCKQLNEEIKQCQTFGANERPILKQNVVLLLIVCLCSYKDDSVSAILSSIEEISKSLQGRLCRFILALRSVYKSLYRNLDTKNRFVQDLIQVMRVISTYTNMQNNELIHSSFMRTMSLPMYITATLKHRVYACMLLPNQAVALKLIQRMTFPSNYLVVRQLKKEEQRINVVVFRKIIRYLPTKNVLRLECIDEFQKAIWRTNVYPPIELTAAFPKYRHPKFDFVFSDKELLAQALAFSLPNWKQIWFYMRWPCNFEIMKRLNFMKEQTKWKITEDELIPFLLSINSI